MGSFADGAYVPSGMFRDKVDTPEPRFRNQVNSDLYGPDAERSYNNRVKQQYYDPTPSYMRIDRKSVV